MRTPLSQKCVLLFIRAPELGKVKTRLEKQLDAPSVLSLYKCFVEDIITTLKKSGHEVIIFFWPPEKKEIVKHWLGASTSYQPQNGHSLGDRMRNAFASVFDKGVKQAVLIGSDFPDLDKQIVMEAFDALIAEDVVVGPAEDGGYYLIGFRNHGFNPDVFSDIEWGSSQVFEQTQKRIQGNNLSQHVLPLWYDIDVYDDLVAFYHRNHSLGNTQLKTMTLLKRFGFKNVS